MAFVTPRALTTIIWLLRFISNGSVDVNVLLAIQRKEKMSEMELTSSQRVSQPMYNVAITVIVGYLPMPVHIL